MDVKDKIKEIIKKNDICLFMKGTPDSPQCGFSMAVSNVLKHLKVNLSDTLDACGTLPKRTRFS